MKMMRNSLKGLIAILLLSCGVDHQGYMSYLFDEENGLVKKSDANGIKYRMIYRPLELIVANELANSSLHASELSDQLQGQDYFSMDIQKTERTQDPKADFYYAFKFEHDIFQLIGQDTIKPSLYNLEHGIGGSQQFRINIAFPVSNIDRQITVQDRFGEMSKFIFKDEDINKIPKLKM